jgi:CRP-like cAMP-binding protein
MDLTAFLQSTFSAQNLIGNASYVFLIASMLMTRMSLLRVLAVGSGLLSVSYSLMINDHVSASWEVVFVAVNLGQLSLQAWRNRASRFTPAERVFREAVVPALEPAQARRVLNAGHWRQAQAGEVLIVYGQLASHMLFITDGEVSVAVHDAVVGTCGQGELVGEMSVLTDLPATATITTLRPTRYLALERQALHRLMARDPEIEQAIDQCYRKGMRRKLAAANEALADAGARVSAMQTGPF